MRVSGGGDFHWENALCHSKCVVWLPKKSIDAFRTQIAPKIQSKTHLVNFCSKAWRNSSHLIIGPRIRSIQCFAWVPKHVIYPSQNLLQNDWIDPEPIWCGIVTFVAGQYGHFTVNFWRPVLFIHPVVPSMILTFLKCFFQNFQLQNFQNFHKIFRVFQNRGHHFFLIFFQNSSRAAKLCAKFRDVNFQTG